MENILFWKIQVARSEEELVDPDKMELFKERLRLSGSEVKDVQQEWEETANKNPLFGRIVSLTLTFVKDNVIRIKYFTGDEEDLLKTFINTVKSPYFNDYTLACFDSQFLLPFLGIRLDINNIKEELPNGLKYRGLRPWDLSGIDVRDFYQGAGAYRPSLRELCYIYKESGDFYDWRDEDTIFYNQKGATTLLEKSSVTEMTSLVNVYRKMLHLEPLSEVEVSEDSVADVVIKEPETLLHELYETKRFDRDFQERLKKQLLKRKITKRDTPTIISLVKAVYREKIETIDRERKEKEFINQERDQEVEEFFENLK